MKILIIGVNGQVGQSLCKLCKKEFIEYIATDRKKLDISDKNEIINFFKNLDVDFVINASAYTNVEKAEEEYNIVNNVNNLAVKYLAKECHKKDIPLIHISTDYIFNGQKHGMYNEEDIPKPLNIYGQTKLSGEINLQNNWKKHIVLRVSWVFSEYGNNFLKTILKLSNSHEKLNVISDQYGSPTSAKSIAEVIIKICKYIHENNNFDNWGIYNYTDFPMSTWHQFATAIVNNNVNTKTKEIQPILASEYQTKAIRPYNSALDVNKLIKQFNIKQNNWIDEAKRIIQKLNR